MNLQQLTDAECGQYNSLLQLTSHLTRDHTFREHSAAQPFPSSSDQLVEQFLEETRSVPQTFRMNELMQEMHEIESRPLPVSAAQLPNADSWASEYTRNSRDKQFHVGPSSNVSVNHEAIWAEISNQEKENNTNGQHVTWLDQYKTLNNATMVFSDVDEEAASERLAGEWDLEYKEENIQNEGELDQSTKFWNKLQAEWKKLADEEPQEEHPWATEFADFYDPYKEYEFHTSNDSLDISEPLKRGKELLKVGDLPGAVLCFEGAVQQDSKCAEAWQLLGITQAENEQDPNAICALKRCLELQPNNLVALMALAVSYTNESYHHQACQSLLAWLKFHPEYSDALPSNFELSRQVTSLLNQGQHNAIQEIFIKVAQRQPINPDYEVQCGLGVLFNLSGDYDKAADCFRAALSVKPDDSRLWNRLGATLANGNRSEEALEAYHRALNLAPGFIRARYNVGITCINLGAYKEAAEHFLIALNQQARGQQDASSKSQMSETVWVTLRLCISLMNRLDLRASIDDKNLEALNQAFAINEN